MEIAETQNGCCFGLQSRCQSNSTATSGSPPSLFELAEVLPAARDNPVIPFNGSPVTFGIWAIARPFAVPFFWQGGAYAGLAIAGANPTDTRALSGMLGAASFAGAAEGVLVIINDLAAGHTLKEAIQHAVCWAAANFSGALAWQVLANKFLDGLSDMTLADIDKLAGPMAQVGGSAAAIFSLVLLTTKIALRCYNPEHYGAANTETIIRDMLVFSFIFVGPTDATFCLSSFNTWFNSGAALSDGFAAAGLAAILKQIALSATGAFLGGLTGLGMAAICHGVAFKVVPFFAECIGKYMESKPQEEIPAEGGGNGDADSGAVPQLNSETPLMTGKPTVIEMDTDDTFNLENRMRCDRMRGCYGDCTLF